MKSARDKKLRRKPSKRLQKGEVRPPKGPEVEVERMGKRCPSHAGVEVVAEAEVIPDSGPGEGGESASVSEGDRGQAGGTPVDFEFVDTAMKVAPPRALAKVDRAGKGEMVYLDPLTLYVREIRRYPVMDPEEEKHLTVLYYEHKDQEAARRLITSNLRLVVKIAFEYRKAYKGVLDLIQEGNLGLLMALKKFDPYKGVRFISYASWWIRAYILRYILNNWRMVRIGTTQTQRKLFFNIHKEKKRLECLGIKPDAATIAKKLDITENEVVEMDRRLQAADLSLDSVVRKDPDREITRLEMLGDTSTPIDDLLALAEFNEELHRKLSKFQETLEEKEKLVFQERLLGDDPLTLQEIGDRFSITRERVRQVENKVMKKLKAYLLQEMGEYFDESVH